MCHAFGRSLKSMFVCEFECFSSRNNLNVSLLDGECKAESNCGINQLYLVLQARGRHVGVPKWDTNMAAAL